MKNVPYHHNPGNACALACYTMAAQYLLPNKNLTFEQLGKIARWKDGYVVWSFTLWAWLMNRGVHIVNYDTIDYESWATKGVQGLEESCTKKVFDFYNENTFDLKAETQYINKMYNHDSFTYINKKPTWDDVVREHNSSGVCDVTVDSAKLNNIDGFILHRVILLDITDTEVIFNDPNKDGTGKWRHEPLEKFKSNFENLDSPELARYYLIDN